MALTSYKHITQSETNHRGSPVTQHQLAPPGLLRCLIVSWSKQRIKLLRAAAVTEAWDAISCSDTTDFLRNAFQQKVPLTLIDLPPQDTPQHEAFCAAAERAKDINGSLLAVSVAEGNASSELWARQLGVWSYLPEMNRQEGCELVFREARQALARQASAYLESSAQAAMSISKR